MTVIKMAHITVTPFRVNLYDETKLTPPKLKILENTLAFIHCYNN